MRGRKKENGDAREEVGIAVLQVIGLREEEETDILSEPRLLWKPVRPGRRRGLSGMSTPGGGGMPNLLFPGPCAAASREEEGDRRQVTNASGRRKKRPKG
jgi:hypothetical protein